MSTIHQTQSDIENEMQLIRLAQADPKKFAPLYDRYYKHIFLFIYRRTDDEETCADITSQVFLKAVLNLPKYEFKGVPFSAWLYRISSNEINLYFRNHKNKRCISIEDAGINKITHELSELNEESDSHEKEKLLMESIQHLSKDEIQFIELRFFEDRSFKEIGFILNTTEGNAKVKTYRILDKIKKLLSKGK